MAGAAHKAKVMKLKLLRSQMAGNQQARCRRLSFIVPVMRLFIGIERLVRGPPGLQFIEFFQQSVAAFDLNILDFLELLYQCPGRTGIISQPLKCEDEFSLSRNMLYAKSDAFIGLHKACFELLPIHVEILAEIVQTCLPRNKGRVGTP